MSRTTDKERREPPLPEGAEDEGLLRRWSRRKHEARLAERHPEKTGEAAPAPVESELPAAPEKLLTDVDMPPIESLDEDSDFSPFMSPGVSDALRQAALRKLFRSPRLNQLCELEGEYFDARGYVALGDVVTYDMRAALEREAEKLKTQVKEKLESAESSAEERVAVAEPTAAPAAEEQKVETPVRTEADARPPEEKSKA